MNNLTNEELARIFAMHINCSVLDLYDNKCGILTGVNYSPDSGYVKHKITHERNYDELRLLLTPLSNITDEHAIEIAKILDLNDWIVRERNHGETVLFADRLMFIIHPNGLIFRDRYTGENLYASSILEAFDRLRQLGYALPYKGQSLFDLGIAIDKTTI